MLIPESFGNMILDMDFAWNEGSKVWFTGSKLRCLFCADIQKKEINVVCQLPDVLIGGIQEYTRVVKFKDKFIFLPAMSKEILIYDTTAEAARHVRLKGYEGIKPVWCTIAGIVEHKLYLIESWYSKRVIILDLVQEEIAAVFDIQYLDADDEIGAQSTIFKDYIFIPVLTREKIISFDLNTYEFREHPIKGDICGCRSICHDKKYCWIIGEHYGIVRWDPDTGESLNAGDIPKEFRLFAREKTSKKADWYEYSEKRKYLWSNDFFCWECLFDGKYVWVIPELSDSILRIDTETLQVEMLSFLSEYSGKNIDYGRWGCEFSLWGVDPERNLRIISKRNYKIYRIETERLSYHTEEWRLHKNVFEMIEKALKDQEVTEKEWFRLENMVSCVKESRLGRENFGKVEIGEKIYHRWNEVSDRAMK